MLQEAMWGRIGTLPTRWTSPRKANELKGQEVVRNQGGLDVGVRNVRARPQRIHYDRPMIPETQITYVPGGYVNPSVQTWYYQKSFEPVYKKSFVSEQYPWLFGPQGLYPDIYDCPDECIDANGKCTC